MTAYEFYYCDSTGEYHLIGILPERRQDSKRITPESITRWGKILVGDAPGIDRLYYTQIEV
jgi:hypothetical protein